MKTPKETRPAANPYGGHRWILHGIFFRAFMFAFMGILFPMAEKTPITWPKAGYQLFLWMAFGLLYGLTMKAILGRQARKKEKEDSSPTS